MEEDPLEEDPLEEDPLDEDPRTWPVLPEEAARVKSPPQKGSSHSPLLGSPKWRAWMSTPSVFRVVRVLRS